MQTLKIDDNNNLVVTQNNLQLLDGINACSQDTKTRIGLVMGENPQNINEGIDYFNEVLGVIGGEDYVKEKIRLRILASAEIINVNSLSLTHTDDKLTIKSTISSIYGVVEL